MRLGQLARKCGVSKKEIISYLKEIDPTLHSLGHNSKLSEQILILVAQRFESPERLGYEEQQQEGEQAGTHTEEATLTQSELNPPDSTAAIEDSAAANEVSSDKTDVLKKKDELVIETDKLLELLESEEAPDYLDKITLIKASKRELEGLKVVGKIELPEPKGKFAKKTEQKKGSMAGSNHHGRKHEHLTEEEREKRSLKFKKRKEEYQAHEEKRRKAREKKQQKALNKTRYQQKLQRAKSNQQKHKDQIPGPPSALDAKQQPAPPRTLLGRFWRWMTTY